MFVMIAMSRSRGESMTRVATTPAALQPPAHGHRQGLLAVGAGLAEEVVEVERDPRQIAEVLQQREEREEDRHRREHDGDDPGGRQVEPVDEDAREPHGKPAASAACFRAGWPQSSRTAASQPEG